MHVPLSKHELTTMTSSSIMIDNLAEREAIEAWDLLSRMQFFDADGGDFEVTDEHDCSGETFLKAFKYASNQRSACNMVRDTLMVTLL